METTINSFSDRCTRLLSMLEYMPKSERDYVEHLEFEIIDIDDEVSALGRITADAEMRLYNIEMSIRSLLGEDYERSLYLEVD